MIVRPGELVLLRFPRADLSGGKLRPVLVVAPVPGHHDDWLVCMVTSRMHQAVEGFDERIDSGDEDFGETGLKVPSLIRIGRLAVVEAELLEGTLGAVAGPRMIRVRNRLREWLAGSSVEGRSVR